MRYAKSESTNILALFNSGDTVTINVYRLSDNTKVVDGASCSEVAETGIFKYLFSQTISQKEEYLWVMNNGEYSKYGKIVLSGWMDDTADEIQNHRNMVEPKIDITISSRASQESVDAIPTADEIADVVWDETTSDHTTSGSFGEEVQSHATKTELDQAEANIRGVDSDSLKTLSDQIDSVKEQTDKIPTIQLDVSFIKDIEGGRWVLDGHQMVFYKEDNTTEVARFDLYNKDGALISEEDDAYERRRV
ncbi:hypothetical protein J7J18_07030 [bacterium]|nr:hypothetical protein [bacterium]